MISEIDIEILITIFNKSGMEGMRTAGKILGEYLDKSKCITYIENTGSGVEIDSASAKIVLSDDTIIGICKMRDLKVP